MGTLTHPVTGHEVKTDDSDVSADFWKAAGYRAAETKKAPAKRAASKSTPAKK